MKIFQSLVALSSFVGFAAASYPGTDEEFIYTISRGELPEGILPEPLIEDANLRKLASEPRDVGQRCGRSTLCNDGLECGATSFGSFCMPVDCLRTSIQGWIERNGLQNYHKDMFAATGLMSTEQLYNTNITDQGWSAIATNAQLLTDKGIENKIVEFMEANPPDLPNLLMEVLDACPQAASKAGVTVLFGGHYELSALIGKFSNTYYFGIGTGDLNFNIKNTSSSVEFQYNISAGIYTDVCGGSGPSVGFDLGLAFGAFLSGTTADLVQCSFMFDFGIATGVHFGTQIGVNSGNCVVKLMFTLGWGLGAGCGFLGCQNYEITKLNF